MVHIFLHYIASYRIYALYVFGTRTNGMRTQSYLVLHRWYEKGFSILFIHNLIVLEIVEIYFIFYIFGYAISHMSWVIGVLDKSKVSTDYFYITIIVWWSKRQTTLLSYLFLLYSVYASVFLNWEQSKHSYLFTLNEIGKKPWAPLD